MMRKQDIGRKKRRTTVQNRVDDANTDEDAGIVL
jgi:hypothetical protein